MVIMPGAPAFHRVPGFAHLQSSSYSFISFHNNPNNIVNNKVPSSSSREAEATPSSLRSRSSSRLLFVAEAAPAFSSSLSLVPLSPLFQAIPSLGPPSSPAPSSSSFLHYLLHPFLNLPPRLPQVHSSHIDAMPRKMPKMTPKMIPQKPLQQSPSNANFLNMRKSCQSL